MQPIGGSELQEQLLHKYVDASLLEKFQITISVPEKKPLSKDKINILWVQNSYDQPNVVPWFKNKENHSKYAWYVFNSHWCYEKYRMMFDVPTNRCAVIKNAIEHFPLIDQYKKGDEVKMIFHPTPWRGLSVILGAMQLLKNDNITLDVYSSTKIYGSEFKKQTDKEYQPLYDQATKLKNVNYLGWHSNQYITDNINRYKIFPYSNIWEETSCISAIEALGAGLHMISTNYGALYETCSEWPVYVQYDTNYKSLAKCFAYAIDGVVEYLHTDKMYEYLCKQREFYEKFYHWKNRKNEWTNFLTGVVDEQKQ